MDQRHYCPCNDINDCPKNQYYNNWCYGELCEEAKEINAALEVELHNRMERIDEGYKEYIKQLQYALNYFENGKTLDNIVPYIIASSLIKNELNKVL